MEASAPCRDPVLYWLNLMAKYNFIYVAHGGFLRTFAWFEFRIMFSVFDYLPRLVISEINRLKQGG